MAERASDYAGIPGNDIAGAAPDLRLDSGMKTIRGRCMTRHRTCGKHRMSSRDVCRSSKLTPAMAQSVLTPTLDDYPVLKCAVDDHIVWVGR